MTTITIGGSCRKYHFCCDLKFCRNKHVFFWWQNMSFVVTKSMLVMTEPLSQQTYFCQDKLTFVVTKLLMWHTCVCHRDKYLLQQKFCCDKNILLRHNFVKTKSFVTASILLSRQKTRFVVTNMCLSGWTGVCRNKDDTCSSSRCVMCYSADVMHDDLSLIPAFKSATEVYCFLKLQTHSYAVSMQPPHVQAHASSVYMLKIPNTDSHISLSGLTKILHTLTGRNG